MLWIPAAFAGNPEPDSIVRENYGVVFTPVAVLDNTHSNWHHTFGYKLNLDPLPNITKYCPSKSGIPQRSSKIRFFTEQDFCPAFRSYNDRIDDMIQQIYKMEEVIDILIPKDNPNRRKRGLLDIVGRVSKTLFGTATTEDTEVMQVHVDHLRKLTNRQANRLMFVEKNLHSFMLNLLNETLFFRKKYG